MDRRMAAPFSSSLPLVESFDSEYLLYNRIFPLSVADGRLRVAVAGDPAPEVLDDLADEYQCELDLVTVDEEELADAVRRTFAAAESMDGFARSLDGEVGIDDDGAWGGNAVEADARDLANQPPVIRFVNLLIREAHESRASDVHLEATARGMVVRFRVDGVLTEAPAPPAQLQRAVVSRVKLLAELDIAERRVPQDGRIRIRLEERELDLRVSTVPTLHGESVVLRLLDQGGRPVTLEELGMMPETLARFRRLASRSSGILLATGPTGSGKTTSLYAALGLRDARAEKIITVEDPIEYHLSGVTQVPVNVKAGVSFAAALRSLLRQDPDVLMVGEMRDSETAHIAVQAAMTGHLVFSTLHTNDAASALTRLADLDIESYMVAATVEAILAQRLVRRVCSECTERYRPDPAMVRMLAPVSADGVELTRGAGCARCRGTGFRGRTGLFELLEVTKDIREEVQGSCDVTRIREMARDEGMVTLREDGWARVRAGITTIDEVLRVAS
jgi:general secretion pathway protein E